MPQNISQNEDWVGEILKTFLMWGWFVLAGTWIVSQWLTRLLFRYLLNPLFNGVFDREDGLVVMVSALLWGAVAALFLFPLIVLPELGGASPAEVGQAFLIVSGLGIAWGTSIGFWLVITWWNDVEHFEANSNPAEVMGLPSSFYESIEPNNGHRHQEPEPEELEGMILGVEWQEK